MSIKVRKCDLIHKKNVFENMRHLVEWAADTYGEKIAYSFRRKPSSPERQMRSFINMRDDVRAFATELISRGMAGKHIAVIGKSSYEWVLSYFSILCANAVIVPLDREWHAKDLADTIAKADCEYIIADPDLEKNMEQMSSLADIKGVFYLSPEGEGSIGELVAMGKEKYSASADAYNNQEIDVNKMSILVFTSGTTGKGKGVMLSQNNVLSDMSDVIPFIKFTDKSVSVLPPHHTFGSSVMIVGHCMIGAEVYISSGLRHIAKEIKEEKPGHLVLVPLYLETFYRKILAGIKAKGQEKKFAFGVKLCKVFPFLRKKLLKSVLEIFGGNLRMVISGGAPLNSEMVDFYESLGIETLNGYGITECAPIISVNHSKKNIKGSVGFPLGIDDIKIDEPNEDGEGEICVKGSNVMLGYFKDEEATAEVFDKDGYFRTGDYGKIERDAIFITGRKKNLIILSNGKNVYPEEIEVELNATPGVLEIIVYEGKSKRGPEYNAIVAEVYPDPEYVKVNNIENFAEYFQPFVDEYNRHAVAYKKITKVRVRDTEFPKNTLRKIKRFELDMSID